VECEPLRGLAPLPDGGTVTEAEHRAALERQTVQLEEQLRVRTTERDRARATLNGAAMLLRDAVCGLVDVVHPSVYVENVTQASARDWAAEARRGAVRATSHSPWIEPGVYVAGSRIEPADYIEAAASERCTTMPANEALDFVRSGGPQAKPDPCAEGHDPCMCSGYAVVRCRRCEEIC
jgi:hypothetical protein